MDYTAQDGRVFIRGIFHTPESCERLLAIYRREAAGSDYFATSAKALADQLEAAMREAVTIQTEQAA